MNDEERLLLRHLQDLSERAQQSGIYTFSDFLSLPEQDLVLRSVREYGLWDYHFEGGSESAERRIIVFGSEASFGYPPELPITVLQIRPVQEKYGEELSHRDILGAVMSLQIERSLTGDIIVRGKNAYIFCLQRIADFLAENLTKIRHTDVQCMRCISDVPELRPVLQEVRLNIASERLDSIVAFLTGISRSHIERLFHEKRVFLNGRIVESLSARPKEGDVITVRGFGKAIYEGISGSSKKGRLYVTLRKYV
ncbi:MAG: hypothetical protein IKS18_04550 [Lachnospiraceae bacterium]|nr:hypothetical protein [Lachnospiraceae bacterium]